MRVLFFSTDFPQPHENLRALFNFKRCSALAANHDVAVLSPSLWAERLLSGRAGVMATGGSRVDHSPFFDVRHPVFYYPPRLLRGLHAEFMWWSCRGEARRLIARFQPDVLLSYWTFPDGEVACRLARHAAIPIVAIVGGSDVMELQHDTVAWARAGRVLRQADAVIAVSETLRKRISDLGVDSSKIRVLPPAVDATVFYPGARHDARARLGASSHPLLLWVGRMAPVKGLGVLLDACARLRREGLTFTLHLLGDGPLKQQLQQQVEHLDLGHIVTFHGSVAPAQIAEWFRAADATVLPSLSEGMPNVLLESIACGTPFVASEVGGIPAIASAELDSLVPPGDVAALTSALRDRLTTRRPQPRATRRVVPVSWTDTGRVIGNTLIEAVTNSRQSTAQRLPSIPPVIPGARSQVRS